MDQTPNNAGGGAAPPVQSAPPPQTGVDTAQYEAELARLRSENDQMRQGLGQLRPYAEDLEWLTADPENAKLLRETRKAYDDARKSRRAVPPELQPLADDIGELKSFVGEFKHAQQQAAANQRQQWMNEGEKFLLDQAAKHPEIKNDLPEIAFLLGRLCEGKGITFEEGWNRLSKSYVTSVSGPPPTSLRADSGFAGLPPPSRQPATESPQGKKLGQIVLERMQSMS